MRCVMQQSGASTKGLMRFVPKSTYYPSGTEMSISYDVGDFAEVTDMDGTVQYIRTPGSNSSSWSSVQVMVSRNGATVWCYISNTQAGAWTYNYRTENLNYYVSQIRFGTMEML